MAKIFISYRRADSAPSTGRIYDRLIIKFGRKNIFKDVDNIPAGVDFAAYIRESLRECAIALVIIGSRWLDIRTSDGARRLDDPADFVRIEVETAFEFGLTVIPILLDGVAMPAETQLPETLRRLTAINGITVRNDPDFDHDVGRVIAAIERSFPHRSTPSIFRRSAMSPPAISPASPAIPSPVSAPYPRTPAPTPVDATIPTPEPPDKQNTHPLPAPYIATPHANHSQPLQAQHSARRVPHLALVALAIALAIASLAGVASIIAPQLGIFASAKIAHPTPSPTISPTATSTPPPLLEPTPFTDTNHNYTTQYPYGWRFTLQSPQSPSGDPYQGDWVIFNPIVRPPNAPYTLLSIAIYHYTGSVVNDSDSQYLRHLYDSYPSPLAVISTATPTISGQVWQRGEYTWTPISNEANPPLSHGVSIVCHHGGALYVIEMVTQDAAWSFATHQYFDLILPTFHFTT